ncbi:LOW QUALITY PROTEIN: queuosine salvage protein-like [Uloborus diversus]|uniref:LOW QUALITY PROTEIN: queuosine salvage protein-like n=1 Tax=Uloborus diversus TaxID=327109 RepID=UPI002409995E|nr:LOW QUALITY PROTEIN: queuosine salvage protein-like [Uloborus diversus]
MMAIPPRDSAELIARIAKNVTISKDGILKAVNFVVKSFEEENIDLRTWKNHPLNPKDPMLPFTVDWIFLVDTLNFSFWSEPGKEYRITFHGETYTGYWSLCAAVNRAIEEGYNITSPVYYSNVSMDALQHIFRSDTGTELPMLAERHKILNESGKTLVDKFEGTFVKCIGMCEQSAQTLLKLIIDNFPSYRDEATIDSHKVSFYKRAQILIGDIWCCFEGKGCGAFNDIDTITIFADYRIPQALVYLGVLKYSDELNNILKKDQLLVNGSQMEVEIRGCSIWAVELICQSIKEKQNQGIIPKNDLINPILVDHFLWVYRRKFAKEMEHVPFHKTRCIYY